MRDDPDREVPRSSEFAVFLVEIAIVTLISVLVVGLLAIAGAGDVTNEGNDSSVTEAAADKPVPEPGDVWFEVEDPDGEWISYVNPRDEYRDPYLGGGSGKICVTVLNEENEPILGTTLPETSVSIPTGESLDWHTSADPFEVAFPLDEHYERPLDADQFGSNPDLPQGDGYLDAHCLEWHGLPDDETVTYGEATVEGAYADHVEIVGYIQQDDVAWDSTVDSIADATSYEEAGGGWTYQFPESHGQVVVVLRLDRPPGDVPGQDDESGGDDHTENGDDATSGDSTTADSDGDDTPDDGTDTDATPDDHGSHDDVLDDGESDGDLHNQTGSDRLDAVPGFGPIAALAGVVMLVVSQWLLRGRSRKNVARNPQR